VTIEAVVFDLDGVLIDSEPVWAEVRRELTVANGGVWAPGAQEAMMGMSSLEWASFMRGQLGVRLAPEAILDGVLARMLERYRGSLPLLPGATATVRRLAARWPLGLASSANRPLIDLVLAEAGLTGCFAVTLSTEEVGRGKPAPDVYLEAARRLGAAPERCAGVEDSTNGLWALHRAGMRVIAVPNPTYPPDPEALALAHAVLRNLSELTVEVVEGEVPSSPPAGGRPSS
jgi:HAD superfamily hydrolase (TIGR01509 family)